MKHAFLLTGFNNWGKSTTIRKIFNRRNFGPCGNPYSIGVGIEIYVQGNSNDDVSVDILIGEIDKSVKKDGNILIAFCPTRERKNNSRKIIKVLKEHGYFIHLILLKYKWDLHAELLGENILKYYTKPSDVHNVVNIEEDPSKAEGAIRAEKVKDYIVETLSK